jgi:hypothetical protein
MADRAVPLSDVAVRIHKDAEELLRLAKEHDGDLSDGLSAVLGNLLVWPYSCGPVSIRELEGVDDPVFRSTVYTSARNQTRDGVTLISAENVACAFLVASLLTPEELRTGYRRIGAIKRVRRPPRTQMDYPINDVPLGIIFCIDSEMSLEQIAQEIVALNKTVPSTEWPDMVVVLQKGTINYAVQIEGDKIRGNFLLPNTTDFPVFPMYVHVFARGVGLYSGTNILGSAELLR